MKKVILFALYLISSSALAYSECDLQVQNIYLHMEDTGAETVWVELWSPAGNAPIYKNNSNLQNGLSEAQLDRFYALALTAYSMGKKLKVRYPEDDLDCSQLSGARSDFIGVRIIG